MYKLAVAAASVLAVLMIVIGGFTYVSSDAMGNKEEGKHQIKAAFGGLLLILASYIILNTVNPQLVSISIISTPLTARKVGEFMDVKNMALASYRQNLNMNTALSSASEAYKTSKTLEQSVSSMESLLRLANDDPCLLNELTDTEKTNFGIPTNINFCPPPLGALEQLSSDLTIKIADEKLNLAIISGAKILRDAEGVLTKIINGKTAQSDL
ncbi:MAG: hypothetical protein AAB649_03245, partial [Patescibacteria group bacterium]